MLDGKSHVLSTVSHLKNYCWCIDSDEQQQNTITIQAKFGQNLIAIKRYVWNRTDFLKRKGVYR
ncbi:hypothetical protein CEK71_05550 [Methylovulum psychrotolerans]|uniref:Uncharacterized protein n=1 Tax=Methylovulum psychrotolerans TaxID=1704499 RepID=A0A1Z4BW92_9GAMM|nr:hypothetical protein CEK71_05550 [Methylovulum psychrotolerans]POZ52875.1 hypothetical protein AADEFJLK_01485 [Methylovulum psychrotolerans]